MTLESQLQKALEIDGLIKSNLDYDLIVDKFFIYADEIIDDLDNGISYNKKQYQYLQGELDKYLKKAKGGKI